MPMSISNGFSLTEGYSFTIRWNVDKPTTYSNKVLKDANRTNSRTHIVHMQYVITITIIYVYFWARKEVEQIEFPMTLNQYIGISPLKKIAAVHFHVKAWYILHKVTKTQSNINLIFFQVSIRNCIRRYNFNQM